MRYTLPLQGALPKIEGVAKKEQEILYNLNSNATEDSNSFNFFQYFQPSFPLPTFHRGNKVDQSNNLAFSVFLQGRECFVKT